MHLFQAREIRHAKTTWKAETGCSTFYFVFICKSTILCHKNLHKRYMRHAIRPKSLNFPRNVYSN